MSVSDKLLMIERHLATRALFDLFKDVVQHRLSGMKRKLVEPVLQDVNQKIAALGKVHITDVATHPIMKEQAKALKGGLSRLDSLRPGTYTAAEVEDAIKKDDDYLKKYYDMHSKSAPSGSIEIYDMARPTEDPIKLPFFPKCRQVRRYLQSKQLAHRPELWARYEDSTQDKKTGNVYMWQWLPQDADIQGRHLEFVSRQNGVSVGDYIVVSKVIKGQNSEEVPEPLDLAPLGEVCCSSKCRNLEAHLRTVWPTYHVTHALTIPQGYDVLSETFDNNLFDPRTNSLYVHLE